MRTFLGKEGFVWGVAAAFLAGATLVHASPSLRPSSPKIRVRIAESREPSRLSGQEFRVFLKDREIWASHARSEWSFECVRGEVRATPVGTSVQEAQLKLVSRAPVRVAPSALGTLQAAGTLYRGEIWIHPSKKGCEWVNHLDLEDYLAALINSEFSSKWAQDSVDAQAIAARSYALAQMRAQKKAHYDVDSDVRDQVYEGALLESPESRRAVERTRGWVLTAQKKPLEAYYHSTCGGRTHTPRDVWGQSEAGYARGVVCPYCKSSPRYSWEYDLDSKSLAQRLVAFFTPPEAQALNPKLQPKLQAIRLVDDARTGRVGSVVTRFSTNVRHWDVVVSSDRFRKALGTTELRSAQFRLERANTVQGQGFRFRGVGNGHGVGLCQWGAKVMGEKGFSYRAILKHYYPGAELSRLW